MNAGVWTFCRPWWSTRRWGKYPKRSRMMLLLDAGMNCLLDTVAVMHRPNRTMRLIGCLTPICCLSLHCAAASQGNFSSHLCIWKCSPWSPQNPVSAYSHMTSPNFKEDDDARDGVARMFCQSFCVVALWMRIEAPEQKPIIWHDFDFKKYVSTILLLRLTASEEWTLKSFLSLECYWKKSSNFFVW